MTRWFATLLIILLTASSAIGDSAGPLTLRDGQVLRGHFMQERRLLGLQAPLRSDGRFTLAPGHGLAWMTERPFAINTIITKAGLVQELDGDRTLSLPADRLPFLTKLYGMISGALSGDWGALESDFDLVRGDVDKGWRVELTPRRPDDPAMPFRSIALAGGQFVETITLSRPNGDVDHLVFSAQALSSSPLSIEETAAFAAPPQ